MQTYCTIREIGAASELHQDGKKASEQLRMRKRKHGYKIAKKASRKLKTIAGRLVRELERKLRPLSLKVH